MSAPEDLPARYRAILRQRAAAEARHPHATLAIERVTYDAYLVGAIQLIDRLSEERDAALAREAAALHEVAALRSVNAMRERVIAGQLRTIRDLRRKLPRWERGQLTAAEAFNCRHNIVDVVGRVVALHERTNGHRTYLVGRCPFCEDSHDSLVVHPFSGQAMCYCCGQGGTAADVVRALRSKENEERTA